MKIFQRRKNKTPSKSKTSSSIKTNSTTSSSSSSPAIPTQDNIMTMYAQMSSTIAQALPSQEYDSHHELYHPSRKFKSQVISPNPNRRDIYVPSTLQKKHVRGRDPKRRGRVNKKQSTPKQETSDIKLKQEEERQVLDVPSPIHVVHKKQIRRDLPDISDDEGSIFFSYSTDFDEDEEIDSYEQDEIVKENEEIRIALEQLESKARELQLEADRVIRQRKGEASIVPKATNSPTMVNSTPEKKVLQQMQNPNRKRLSIDTGYSMESVTATASKATCSPNKVSSSSSPSKPLAPGLANRLKIDTGFDESNNVTPKTGVKKTSVKVFGHDQIHCSPDCSHTGDVSPSSTVSSLTMPNELEYAHHPAHNAHHRCTCHHSTLPMIHEDTGMLGEI